MMRSKKGWYSKKKKYVEFICDMPVIFFLNIIWKKQ